MNEDELATLFGKLGAHDPGLVGPLLKTRCWNSRSRHSVILPMKGNRLTRRCGGLGFAPQLNGGIVSRTFA